MANHLRRLAAALDLFRDLKTLDGRGKGADVPVQMFETLVLIAAEPDISMRELQDRLGLASSSTSRNVAALSDRHRSGEPGFGLIEKYEDLRDIRFKRVRLTAKGRAFVSRLNAIMGG